MPLRDAIVEEFLSAIEGLVERPTPATRQPMRAPGGAGPQAGPDLEAARRAAGPARASAEGEAAVGAALRPERTNAIRQSLQTPEARASIAGHAAIRQEFDALITQAQSNPEPRFRGELRPDVRSQPPQPPAPPTGLQNAPLSTQQLRGVMERTGRQAQRLPQQGQLTNRNTAAGRQRAEQDRLAAQQAARDRLTSLGAPPAASPSSLVQQPGQPGSGRFVAGQRVPSQNLAPRTNPPTTASSPRLPTPAQTTTQRALSALLPQPQRQPITPSRANQPQTGTTARPPAPPTWDEPATNWFNRNIRQQLGMTPDTFVQHYFAGFVQNPSTVRADRYGGLRIEGTVRAPQDMVAPGRNGGPEVRIPAGTYLGSIQREFRPQQREVYNAYFALSDQYQGLGVARTVFRNQIDVYRRMGNIDRVTVSAGLDGGGHTWARFGFVPSRDGWIGLRSTLMSRLRGISNLPPAQRALAEQIIRMDDPIAIRALAALPMAPGGQGSALGRRLLGGTGWRGTLDLRDPRDMNYFDAYVTPRPRQ